MFRYLKNCLRKVNPKAIFFSLLDSFLYYFELQKIFYTKGGNMNNNDVLRRVRYVFDFNDTKMMTLFAAADHKVTRAEISDWLKKDDDEAQKVLSDKELAIFLNGLINDKRGKREGAQPIPEEILNNNIIFMKLKIALNLKAEDVLEIMELADFRISKHELSAFFRRKNHKHYQICKDQILRYFLKGVQIKYRKNVEVKE